MLFFLKFYVIFFLGKYFRRGFFWESIYERKGIKWKSKMKNVYLIIVEFMLISGFSEFLFLIKWGLAGVNCLYGFSSFCFRTGF